MNPIYKVRSQERLHHSDPLHIGRFYPHQERTHRRLMQDRQDLILYLANIHSVAAKSGIPIWFNQIPMRLTTLREWVYDYKTVFDHFFEVVQHGYNLGEKNEISIVTPRLLEHPIGERKLVYVPPPLPKDGTVSKVFVQQHNRDKIIGRLIHSGRLDLSAPVMWLLGQTEVNFYFQRSGKLKLRDTSVWPVPAIETWPSWLREDLFGEGIDIESAYTQFLVSHIRAYYEPKMLQLLYPDLLRSLEDKKAWRKEICCDILGMEYSDDNISIVKKICMSLANGSRISPGIMLGGISVTKDIVLKKIADDSPTNLITIGKRLSVISNQYSQARKVVCALELGLHPSRLNQKLVFSNYFEWERKARYAIWEAVERHGIMVHDGIDGVPEKYLKDIPGLVKSLNLRLT